MTTAGADYNVIENEFYAPLKLRGSAARRAKGAVREEAARGDKKPR